MGDWPTVLLKDTINPSRGISYGIVQPGPNTSGGVPIVRVSDVRNGLISTQTPLRVKHDIERQYARTRLEGGELLLTIVGTIGETAVAPPDIAGWNVARAIAVLPVQDDIGARWIQYALKHPLIRAVINSKLNTTVQATLNLGDIAQLPIPLPSPKERKIILSFLGSLDDKIHLNRRMNETLEAMALAIFKDWFVDFGPTRAKMEGREPYLAREIWDLFPNTLDAAGKPEGWINGILGDIATSPRAGVQPSEVDSETPYIGLEHMPRRCIALYDWEWAGTVSSAKSPFRRGDFLFGKLRPYFHKVGVAAVDGICSTDIVVVKPAEQHWRTFAIACISTDEFVNYTDRTSTGTKMPRTSWAIMAQYELSVPTIQLARAFDDLCWPMIDRILSNIIESRILAQTRDLLLPKLISGEIHLKDAEKAVENAL